MRKFILIVMLALLAKNSYCQSNDTKSDCVIYNAIVQDFYKNNHSPILIKKNTSTLLLKAFHFKDPYYHVLNKKRLTLSNEWEQFLYNIDTNKVTNKTIKCVINSDSIKETKHSYTFSPVIFSADGSKAICFYDYLSGVDASSGGAFLLEKKNGNWIIVNFIRLYLS